MIITLKDGSSKEFEGGISISEITSRISEGLLRASICAKLNGELVDMSTIVLKDSNLEILTFNDDEGKEVYRHSTAHVLAKAVKNVFPTCKLAIGPAISSGFYYDFDFKTQITFDDFAKIEVEMQRLIKCDEKIERKVVSKTEALKIMKEFQEVYKQEIIKELPDDATISLYFQGDFCDLCKGPHISSTSKIKAFKLTSLAGAYWKGDEKNKMLTRIYGTAFDKKSNLEEYLVAVEEAKKRDHNKIGRELGLFMTEEDIGQGLPLLMPKGAKIMQILQRFVEDEEQKRGFVLTKTPFMAKSNLYKTSGHWSHYKDKMFVVGDEAKDEEVLALRPMTCPFQFAIYKNGLKSYRDLPIRYSETATLFRKEASGEMHGLIRVRQFTLSDGHIVCTPSQVEAEFGKCLDLSYFLLEALGLKDEVTFRFSKRGKANKDKYIDNDAAWESTEKLMKEILDRLKIKYVEADDEAAFYGPKLDIQSRNVYGKEDTIITIQVDFALAERFDMAYVDADGNKQRPMIIHRSSIGCYERTLAMLIEKYAGAFPLWFAPVQVKVMSLTDRTAQYANELADKLLYNGIRVEVDNRGEKIGYKIREAQMNKIPYMLIVGDKEKENNEVSVRSRSEGDLGVMSFENFVLKVMHEDKTKKIF